MADDSIVKQIPLTQGKFALVDAEDYEWLMGYKWMFNSGGYAIRYTPMHRAIIDAPTHLVVDHINGNRLDNRKCNLRICTRAENHRNTKGHHNRSAKYKGVVRWRNKFKARIRINYKLIYLGLFSTQKEAALAYNEAAKKYFGRFARLNEVIL